MMGCSVLFLLCLIVALAIAAGADLHHAVAKGSLAEVKRLLDDGDDVNEVRTREC